MTNTSSSRIRSLRVTKSQRIESSSTFKYHKYSFHIFPSSSVDLKMLKLFGQLRRLRRRNPHSLGGDEVSGPVDTETASYSNNNNTQHEIIDDLPLAYLSKKTRKRKRTRKQASCSSGGENDAVDDRDDDDVRRGVEVRRFYREVDHVDEEGGCDVSRIDGGVDHDVSRIDGGVNHDVSRIDAGVDGADKGGGGDVGSGNDENYDDDDGDVRKNCRGVDEEGDASRGVDRVDNEGDEVRLGSEGGDPNISREVDDVEDLMEEEKEGDDVSRFDVDVDNVEGLINEVSVKDETMSFCAEERDDDKEGKGVEVRKNRMEVPPDDDCCPICFGSFVVPCRGPCGHWYCGGCILQYWNYTAALQPCSCPMCSQKITILTPEASLSQQQDAAVTEVLRNVRKYNRLFLGGTYGMILKMFELPLYIKRMFTEMMNPDRPGAHLNKIRIFAMILGFFYSISPFDFLHIGRHNVVDLFDYSAIFLSLVLYGVGIYTRRRRFQNVRELAAIQL